MPVSAKTLFEILKSARCLKLLVIQTPVESSKSENSGLHTCPASLVENVKYPATVRIDSDSSEIWSFLGAISTRSPMAIRLTTAYATCPPSIKRMFEQNNSWSLRERTRANFMTRM
ncbi:hypothetical protein BD626DRAFT_3060 [Schizophyllum amplum]|uniref:Uncharacterized protein n=1 Tax=Schizophyllum amplum TaxID=97359 RepID=A0A550CVV4_9AGAR|nr:hypothetical protein BD626DRAFT_3060 [Auriculariopsis ampla]